MREVLNARLRPDDRIETLTTYCQRNAADLNYVIGVIMRTKGGDVYARATTEAGMRDVDQAELRRVVDVLTAQLKVGVEE